MGYLTKLTYDTRGNVTQKTQYLPNPGGGFNSDGTSSNPVITTSVFGDSRNPTLPTQVTDALGRVTMMTYDANGNTLTTVHVHELASGQTQNVTTSATFNGYGQVLTKTDALGVVNVTNTYDSAGNLSTSKDGLGNITSYTYNNDGTLKTTTDSLNHVVTMSYDAYGDPIIVADASGHQTSFQYDLNGDRVMQLMSRTSSVTGVTQQLPIQIAYDPSGHVNQTTAPDGAQSQTIYNSVGLMDHTVDSQGRITSYTYDTQGRLITTNYPDGTQSLSAYDADSNKVLTVSPDGDVQGNKYDSLNRLIETDDYGRIQNFNINNPGTLVPVSISILVLDMDGETTSSTDPNGKTTSYVYDDLGRKIETIDALGNIVQQSSYDLNGNLISSTDANNHTTGFVYDSEGNLLSTQYPDGTTIATAYDVLNRAISKTDHMGLVTQSSYDVDGRLVSVTTPLGNVLRLAYDELGEKIAQTDANGHITRFAYDSKGHLTDKWLPENQHMSMTYNLDGSVNSETDFNGHTTNMGYDSAGRLTSEYDSTGTLESSIYNQNGTLASKTKYSAHGNVTTSYAYNVLGKIAYITTANSSGVTTSVSYTYDLAGNKKTQTTWMGSPSNGTATGTLTYDYDSDERLDAVHAASGQTMDETNATIIASYVYDKAGNKIWVGRENGVTTSYNYDSLNRLTSVVNAKNGIITSSYTYSLSPSGKRQSVTDKTGATTYYVYDNDGRLIEENSAATGMVTYTYDNVGNRLSKTVNGTTTQTFIYNADDRITSYNGNSSQYSYDANGNVLSDGNHTYSWDWDNKLSDSDINTGNHVAYTYNTDNLRVQQVTSSGVTNYTLDITSGFGDVIEERDSSGNLQARYDYGDDLIRLDRSSTPYYYLYDGVGSVRQLTDVNGNIINSDNYDAFGNLLSGSTNAVLNSFLFDGQQQDSTTGLYFLRARYMDPTRDEFLGQDPAEGDPQEVASLHRYLYAAADPVSNQDPSGESFFGTLGTTIHHIIWENFELLGAGRTRLSEGASIADIAGVPRITGSTSLEPDLVDVTDLDRKYLFEIKPFNYFNVIAGELQLQNYINILKGIAYEGGGTTPWSKNDRWGRGRDLFADYYYHDGINPTITLGGGYSAVVVPPLNGMIYYIRVRSTPSAIAGAVAASASLVGLVSAGAGAFMIQAMASENPLAQVPDAGVLSASGDAAGAAEATTGATEVGPTILTLVSGGLSASTGQVQTELAEDVLLDAA